MQKCNSTSKNYFEIELNRLRWKKIIQCVCNFLIFRLHDEIEVINIWMIKVYNELITVRRKSHDDQIASIDNSLSCTERNPTATILYNLRTQCMFCGQGPKNEFDRLFECVDCQYAHYCSIECMEKYRAYHRYLSR